MKNDTASQGIEVQDLDRQLLLGGQLEHANATWRWQIGFLVQAFTILVVANIGLLGYAFGKQRAGIIVLGALFPLVFFVILKIVSRLVVPTVYTAIAIEHELLKGGLDGLMTTLVAVTISKEHIESFIAISSEKDFTNRINSLQKIRVPIFGKYTRSIEYILIIYTGCQLISAVLLVFSFGWYFF